MSSRVVIKGLGAFGQKQFKNIVKLSEKQLADIAKNTEFSIKQKIKESLQRPGSTGNLESSFFAEPIGTRGWGIGNISFLNQHAKYWRWINFGIAATGRTTPPSTIGAFSPGNPTPNKGDFRTGRFQQGSGPFLLKPTRPIQAHNFIARTLLGIPNLISRILSRTRL